MEKIKDLIKDSIKIGDIIEESKLESLIKTWTNDYIKPMELEKIDNITYSGEIEDFIHIKYDIVKELENLDSQIYQNIKTNLNNYTFKAAIRNEREIPLKEVFIKTVVKKWLGEYSYLLKEKMSFIFEEDIDTDEINLDNIITKIIRNHGVFKDINNPDELMNIIKNEIILDYEDHMITYGEEPMLDSYLNYIKYDSIIQKLYQMDIEMDFADDLDEFVNEIYEYNKSYNLKGLEEKEIYLNICPRQDGNDEGSDLGFVLDHMAIKLDEYHMAYYNHNEGNKIDQNKTLNWLFESQGYKIEDALDEEKIKTSRFINSFRYEILSEQNSCQFLTFLVKTDLRGLIKLINKEEFIIPKDVICGFANFTHGSCCSLDIKLEKDIKLNFDLRGREVFQVEDTYISYGYKLSRIIGFNENYYKEISFCGLKPTDSDSEK